MVNKLRGYAALSGAGVALLALWALTAYEPAPGSLTGFGLGMAVGVIVAVTPLGLAYAKFAVARRRRAESEGTTYVSSQVDVDRERFLDRTRSALSGNEVFVTVKERLFPEGAGLLIGHTRFHGTFVRLTEGRQIVVTGVDPEATSAVVAELEDLWSVSLSDQASNPLFQPTPVRGAPRVLLTVLLTAVVVVDVLFIATVAYPGPTYNPGEKATLVSYDLREDVDPGASETDVRLAKASFLISVLREEANEIRWQAGLNRTEGTPEHDADAISEDITRLLSAARADDPDSSQRARIDRLESEHDRAWADVQAALADARNGTAGSSGGDTDAALARARPVAARA